MSKKKYLLDPLIFWSVLLLTLFGLIMVISAHASVFTSYGALKYFFEIGKIIAFTVFGLFLMNFISKRMNQTWLNRHVLTIYIIVAIMMIATLFFPAVNGAKAWINLKVMTIQPVEFVKIALIIYLATYFSNSINSNKTALKLITPPLLVLSGVFLFIFVLQNDLGSALIIVMISLAIFYAVPNKKLRYLKIGSFLLIIIFLVLFYANGQALSSWVYSLPDNAPFKSQLLRIAVLFDPLHNVYTSGYQLANSLAALTDSFFGHGFGNSTTKFIVPEPYNDAILSVIVEETGIFGIIVVFGTYFLIVFQLLNYAVNSLVSLADSLVLVGIATFFMAQFFVNIGGMIGVIPMTGVTLLFISSGGSSIITAFMVIGYAQAIIRKYRSSKNRHAS